MIDEQLLRYSRHILLEDFDVAAQQQLLDSSVLVVGLGGLGSPVAMYLAASGVGHLLLADDDEVDLSNLQRQIAHTEARVGESKVQSARAAISQLNKDVSVECVEQRLAGEALQNAVASVDAVVDCSDNFTTRFALNAACVAAKKPLISAAAIRSEGQLSVFDSRQPNAPCYRCLYSDANDEALNCSESGVLAPVVGVMGSLQALETLKVLTGYGEAMVGRLLVWDFKSGDCRTLKLSKDPACPVCGDN